MSFDDFKRRPTRRVSTGEIASAASLAGFKGEDLKIAVAVALAESDGYLDIYNGTCCYGLWQIHRLWNSQYPSAFTLNAYNQARTAKAIRDTARGWKHWEVYTLPASHSRSFVRFLPQAEAAVGGGATGTGIVEDAIQKALTPDWAEGFGNALDMVTEGKLWIRIGSAMLGLTLLTVGIILLAKDIVLPGALKGVNKAAKKVKTAKKAADTIASAVRS